MSDEDLVKALSRMFHIPLPMMQRVFDSAVIPEMKITEYSAADVRGLHPTRLRIDEEDV